MGSGLQVPLRMAIGALIKAVAPAGAATKWIEAGLDCSPRQAKRILSEGIVAHRFREPLARLIDRAIDNNSAQLERLRTEARALSHEAMLARASDRHARTVGRNPSVGERQTAGAETASSVIEPSHLGRKVK